jgi:hypothetical protein
VITGWHHALEETADPKNECSTGFTEGDYTNAEKQPNYAELRAKFGHPFSRGPNGELFTYCVGAGVQRSASFQQARTFGADVTFKF